MEEWRAQREHFKIWYSKYQFPLSGFHAERVQYHSTKSRFAVADRKKILTSGKTLHSEDLKNFIYVRKNIFPYIHTSEKKHWCLGVL